MTLSELIGDEPLIISERQMAFLKTAQSYWSSQIDHIISENRKPAVKTKIHVKKAKKNG